MVRVRMHYLVLGVPWETAPTTEPGGRISITLRDGRGDCNWWDWASGLRILDIIGQLKKSTHLALQEFSHLAEWIHSWSLWLVHSTNGRPAPSNQSHNSQPGRIPVLQEAVLQEEELMDKWAGAVDLRVWVEMGISANSQGD